MTFPLLGIVPVVVVVVVVKFVHVCMCVYVLIGREKKRDDISLKKEITKKNIPHRWVPQIYPPTS